MSGNQITPEWRAAVYSELERFALGKWRSEHIEVAPIRVYVRRSIRFGRCLDVAVIEVWPDRWQQGHCKAFLQEAEKIAAKHFGVIYVENALNKHLFAALGRYGYNELPPCSFYKKFPMNKDVIGQTP